VALDIAGVISESKGWKQRRKEMDLVVGVWMLWILLMFYLTVIAKSLVLKTLTVAILALSAHDAWSYIKDLKELKESKAQELENKEKEKSKKDP